MQRQYDELQRQQEIEDERMEEDRQPEPQKAPTEDQPQSIKEIILQEIENATMNGQSQAVTTSSSTTESATQSSEFNKYSQNKSFSSVAFSSSQTSKAFAASTVTSQTADECSHFEMSQKTESKTESSFSSQEVTQANAKQQIQEFNDAAFHQNISILKPIAKIPTQYFSETQNQATTSSASVRTSTHVARVDVESAPTPMVTEEEDYKTVPIKCLIDSFEQSTRPVLRYSQLREPSTEEMKQLPVSQPDYDMHQPADNYYVANATVKTRVFMPVDTVENKMESVQSEVILNGHEQTHQTSETLTQSTEFSSTQQTQQIQQTQSTGCGYIGYSQLVSPPQIGSHQSSQSNYNSTPPYSSYQSSVCDYPARETPQPKNNYSFNQRNCKNYNTAARGWGQVKDYYRPVTFDKPMPYTDY